MGKCEGKARTLQVERIRETLDKLPSKGHVSGCAVWRARVGGRETLVLPRLRFRTERDSPPVPHESM